MISQTEIAALKILHERGGSILIYEVSPRNEKDEFGFMVPGLTVFKKLDKKGFVVITEEDEDFMIDGASFRYTPSIEITEQGLKALKESGE